MKNGRKPSPWRDTARTLVRGRRNSRRRSSARNRASRAGGLASHASGCCSHRRYDRPRRRDGADDRIAFVHQAVKGWRLEPRLLDELELPLEIGVEAHEEQAGVASFLRPITAADAKDAVTIGNRQLLLRAGIEALARIRAADV